MPMGRGKENPIHIIMAMGILVGGGSKGRLSLELRLFKCLGKGIGPKLIL